MGGFDPATTVAPSPAPRTQFEGRSPIRLVLDHIAAQSETSFEVLDLQGYPTATWKRSVSRRGMLWREPMVDGVRRYWIVKKPEPAA
jgi:hypothetical protein